MIDEVFNKTSRTLIRERERMRERERDRQTDKERETESRSADLRSCYLLHFQGVIQQRGGWKVILNIIPDDYHTHVRIVELLIERTK